MADSSQASLGGFDADFVEQLEKDYECPVCLLALREPLQTSCGHLMCTSCLDRITERGQLKCPVDNQVSPRSEAFPDLFHGRKVLDLKVRCPHWAAGCHWTGELRRLQDHHLRKSGACKFSTTECAFRSVGCVKGLRSGDEDSHEEGNLKKHMKMLLKSYHSIQKQNADLTRQMASMNVAMQTVQADNRELRMLIQPGGLPAGQELRDQSFKVCWVIENWRETCETARQENDHSLLSRPFYTNNPGYKVCMQAYPNGFGNGRGTHLSMFMKLMKGRYDGDLVWPFAQMFSITLVDQRPGGHDKTRTLDPPLASEGSADAFKRPASDMNRGWGWQTFMAHTDIDTRGFIKDNCVKLRLEIFS